MEYFCGLDVAIEETAVCVVDDRGEVHLTTKVASDPDALFSVLKPFVGRLRRVGHEAGSLSPWLHPELIKLGLPAICLETQHVRAAMSAQRNKTDEKDALGIAHIMRTGWFKAAHVKTESCYRMRLLLTHRRNLKRKFLDLENAIRHSLKSFGIKLGGTSRGKFDQAVREAVADDPLSSELMDAMLTARAMLWKQYCRLHDLVVKMVARSELCRRFLAIPGVGPVTALSFMTAIDDPTRFRRSRDVAAYFGLTARRWQSGTSIDVKGRISKAGELHALDHRIKQLDQEFEALAKSDQRARLLRSVPGIGALNATALAAAVGDVSAFAKGRDFAAWLGLVPRQITTGGKPRLTGISKRGSTYMRVLLIHGARAALPYLARMDTQLGAWLQALLRRGVWPITGSICR